MVKEVRIVILQRGWVFVGNYKRSSDVDGESQLTESFCIRRWGTTKGIGELTDGPTKSTILDKVGTVKFNDMTVVASIVCGGEKWSAICV